MYHQSNKERILERVKQWQKDNPEKVKANKQRYAERRKEALKQKAHLGSIEEN